MARKVTRGYSICKSERLHKNELQLQLTCFLNVERTKSVWGFHTDGGRIAKYDWCKRLILHESLLTRLLLHDQNVSEMTSLWTYSLRFSYLVCAWKFIGRKCVLTIEINLVKDGKCEHIIVIRQLTTSHMVRRLVSVLHCEYAGANSLPDSM